MEISLAGTRTGEFLLSEAGGERSRELIRLPAGQGMLAAGTLLKADNTVAANGADAVKVLYGPVDTGANAGELPVTRAPKTSLTCTTIGPSATPAVPVSGSDTNTR